jgi:hypothetical protein
MIVNYDLKTFIVQGTGANAIKLSSPSLTLHQNKQFHVFQASLMLSSEARNPSLEVGPSHVRPNRQTL